MYCNKLSSNNKTTLFWEHRKRQMCYCAFARTCSNFAPISLSISLIHSPILNHHCPPVSLPTLLHFLLYSLISLFCPPQSSLLSPSSLCSKLQIQTQTESAYFLETLAGNFMDVVQYNEDNRGFEVRQSRYMPNNKKWNTINHAFWWQRVIILPNVIIFNFYFLIPEWIF